MLGVGPGIRDVLWLQGCHIGCKSCANKDYTPHIPKKIMDIAVFIRHFQNRKYLIDGITVTGGEPTEQAKALTPLLKAIQGFGLSTVVYTGHDYAYLSSANNHDIIELLQYVDLLIDGPFDRHQASYNLDWRGALNQRLIYLTDRLKNTQVSKTTGEIQLNADTLSFVGCGTIPLFNTIKHNIKSYDNTIKQVEKYAGD